MVKEILQLESTNANDFKNEISGKRIWPYLTTHRQASEHGAPVPKKTKAMFSEPQLKVTGRMRDQYFPKNMNEEKFLKEV